MNKASEKSATKIYKAGDNRKLEHALGSLVYESILTGLGKNQSTTFKFGGFTRDGQDIDGEFEVVVIRR